MSEQDAPQPASPNPSPSTPLPGDPAAQALQAAQDALAKAKAANAASDATGAAQAAAAAADASRTAGHPNTEPAPFAMPAFTNSNGQVAVGGIDLLGDVALQVKIELGRTRMLVEDVLSLAEGSVVELDKLAGDPVDVYVNDRHVARGEVLVLNDNFCVRINEILAHNDLPKS